MYGATEAAERQPLLVHDRTDRTTWMQWAYATLTIVVVASMVAGGLAGLRPAVISGISMEPELSSGDFAIVDDVAAEDIEVGDIVRVRVGGAAMIHRVIEVEDGANGLVFTTQGDNVQRPDPPVSSSAIDGRVVFAVPLLGLPVVWLKGAS
jgi:signal peptidase I